MPPCSTAPPTARPLRGLRSPPERPPLRRRRGDRRLLGLIERFRFDDAELEFLREHHVVRDATIDWLADYRFRGDIWGYREIEAYFPVSRC